MPEAPAALHELETACGEVFATWADALLSESRDPGADVDAMSGDGLVRALDALARLGRRVEALQARCAAGVASRSRGSDGGQDLARRQGFSSPERLIAQATGGAYSDAVKLVAVGEATATRAAFDGTAPPRRPHLAAALGAGLISLSAADVIRRFLDGLSPAVPADAREAAEQLLVDRAPEIGADGLTRLTKLLRAELDPDGVKAREDELRDRRSLSIWEDSAGMINLRGAFDPANGAPIKLAVEALVGAELHRARDARRPARNDSDGVGSGGREGAASGTDSAMAEQRTINQMNADALSDIARLSLASPQAPAALRSAVVVARIDVESLESGHGHATIDGIDQPVSTATAHEIAASAGIMPMFLRERRHVLDLGRAARLFSAAQKIALIERDGGCAWPGCQRPPSHCEAHHIRWWSRHSGRTDLANGIMLCSHHHHRVHDDGWGIVIRDHRSWFIPPPDIDPQQRPRPGNVAPRHLTMSRLAEAG